jgi:hypothetical protein
LLNIIAGTLSTGAPPVLPTSYESIATVTVGSGGSSTITFSSIPSTFTHLQIRGIARGSRSDQADGIIAQYNSDTGANYSWHELQGSGSSVTAVGVPNVAYIGMQDSMAAQTGGASIFGVLVIDILDYANTNKYKTQRSLTGNDRNGAGYVNFSSGSWRNTNAITSIDLKALYGTGFAQYTTFALYGIKGV